MAATADRRVHFDANPTIITFDYNDEPSKVSTANSQQKAAEIPLEERVSLLAQELQELYNFLKDTSIAPSSRNGALINICLLLQKVTIIDPNDSKLKELSAKITDLATPLLIESLQEFVRFFEVNFHDFSKETFRDYVHAQGKALLETANQINPENAEIHELSNRISEITQSCQPIELPLPLQ